MNNQYVYFKKPEELAKFISELVRQGMKYIVIEEIDGWSVRVTGF